jgi:small subunit ribosomal protein S9
MADDDSADTPDTPADEVEAKAQVPAEGSATEADEQSSDSAESPAQDASDFAAEELVVEELVAEELVVEELVAEELVAEERVAEEAAVEEQVADEDDDEEEPAPRVKPSVPGAHLEVDIVPEGVDPLGRGEHEYEDPYAIEDELEEAGEVAEDDREEELTQPIATAAIDLASGARYRATGKRKTAIARVTLRPGTGEYVVNGRPLDTHFPRTTLQRNIRQPLETVGYQDRMDVIARLHGGGISAQAGALRHGVSRALLEADPNLRGELKRRGFLTRDSRAKERKKAGLKKARKRPQFSKR